MRGPSVSEVAEIFPKAAKGWKSPPMEIPAGFYFSQDQIEGEIPKELYGTFFRNGPGGMEVYNSPLIHPIDGDGLICSLSFQNGQAHFRSKFVDTRTHVAEEKESSMLYDGMMGSRAPAAKKKKGWRDPANTNVYFHGGKLLGLYESSLPWSIRPHDLSTIGADNLGGALKLKSLAAHYRWDSEKDRLVSFSQRAGIPFLGTKSQLSVYEFDNNFSLLNTTNVSIDGFNYAHDLLLTPNWYIFQSSPFFDTSEQTAAQGKVGPGQCVHYTPGNKSQICLIERRLSETSVPPKVICLDSEPCHIYHFANCYEEDDIITFQAVCLPINFTMVFQHEAFLSNMADAPGIVHTYKINPKNGTISRFPTPGLETTSCEFPATNPYRHVPQNGVSTRYTYLMAGAPSVPAPFTDVVKYDVETNMSSRWHSEGVVGEPCFVPRLGKASATFGDEDDGWVIVQLFRLDNEKVEFIILDAKNLSKGPVCRLKMPFHIPYGFHGTFCPQVFIQSDSKL